MYIRILGWINIFVLSGFYAFLVVVFLDERSINGEEFLIALGVSVATYTSLHYFIFTLNKLNKIRAKSELELLKDEIDLLRLKIEQKELYNRLMPELPS
jgi:hypothetical protein